MSVDLGSPHLHVLLKNPSHIKKGLNMKNGFSHKDKTKYKSEVRQVWTDTFLRPTISTAFGTRKRNIRLFIKSTPEWRHLQYVINAVSLDNIWSTLCFAPRELLGTPNTYPVPKVIDEWLWLRFRKDLFSDRHDWSPGCAFFFVSGRIPSANWNRSNCPKGPFFSLRLRCNLPLRRRINYKQVLRFLSSNSLL